MTTSGTPKLDKNLGQHFLVNRGIIDKIVKRTESLSKERVVIEIGPGGGALTAALLAAGIRVLAVEFDERWISELSSNFASEIESGKLQLVHADATLVDHAVLRAKLKSEKITLCGNLPYNRGQEIVMRFFEQAGYVDAFVVMLQKEVADKFGGKASRKSFGPQAVKFEFLTEGMESFAVSPGSFKPPPKVESSVVSFRRKGGSDFDPIMSPKHYAAFSQFLEDAFRQRRKKLSNNIGKQYFTVRPEFADKRAEELTAKQLHELWRSVSS